MQQTLFGEEFVFLLIFGSRRKQALFDFPRYRNFLSEEKCMT